MGCYDPDVDKSGKKKKQMMTVKCRDEKLGLEVHLKARADTKFSTIMYHYRTKFNIDEVTFTYQGKKLKRQDSPYSVGMEDNTVIFVRDDFTKEELATMVWDSKKWRWIFPQKEGEPRTDRNSEALKNDVQRESVGESSREAKYVGRLVQESELPVVG